MKMLIRIWILAWLSITGLGMTNEFQRLEVYRIHNITELTPYMLRNHDLVFADGDRSVILSESFRNTDISPFGQLKEFGKARKPHGNFVQIRYSLNSSISGGPLQPVYGCFDNSFSDTESTVACSLERAIHTHMGITLILHLAELQMHGEFSISYADLSEEKVICTAAPGQKLQVQVRYEKRIFQAHEERRLKLSKSSLGTESISFTPWRKSEEPSEFEIVDGNYACITDQEMLLC